MEKAALDDMLVERRPGVVGVALLDGDMHVIGHVLHEVVDVPVNVPTKLDLTFERLEGRGEADVVEIVGNVGERDPELAVVDLVHDGD